ncbi:MAG TPA: hypothetical protein VNH14_09955 [Gemmatimonadales bacterium]|nr:hypothetical protein [Gemmatimonadales bacterium]
MEQGIPVTWNNPDIWLTELDGTPVESDNLQAGHTYVVNGRIWDASFDAALGVQVRCYRRSRGINAADFTPVELNADGTERVVILNIPPYSSRTAQFKWTTPPQGGHICLRVECAHPDDLNTANNVGQENTTVLGVAAGERARVVVRMFNPSRRRAAVRLQADIYEPREQEWEFRRRTQTFLLGHGGRLLSREEKATHLAGLRRWITGTAGRFPRLQRHQYQGRGALEEAQRKAATPLPPGWRVTVDGKDLREGLTLEPMEERDLEIVVAVPGNVAPRTRVPININATDPGRGLLGGMTLIISVGTGRHAE